MSKRKPAVPTPAPAASPPLTRATMSPEQHRAMDWTVKMLDERILARLEREAAEGESE